MSLSTLKCIGLGILGLGGVSSAAALSSSKVRKFIGISSVISQSSSSTPSSTPDASVSDLSEEDRQWQFLYQISKKVFESLKQAPGSDLSSNPKDNVIKWLKDKFNSSLESEEDTWENFKSLCEAQTKQETHNAPNVDNEYSRLCFLDVDEENEAKGFLWKWYNPSDLKDTFPKKGVAFQDLSKKNIELWTSFKSKYSNANPVDKFDEWYSSASSESEEFKRSMDVLINGQTVQNTLVT